MRRAQTSNGELAPGLARLRGRLTGGVYLLYFVTAILAETVANRGHGAYGLALNLISAAFYVAVTVLFFYLFKPVNTTLSLLAATISLAGCAITVLNLFHLASRISPLFFFGPYCLLLGYLIFRSTFLPRVLGALMMLAGLGWLTFLVLSPTSRAIPYVEGLGILAEGLLMLWLLILGVNPRRWNERAERTGALTTNGPTSSL
jgi:drug/metabolite transporter (DMT)-like permease